MIYIITPADGFMYNKRNIHFIRRRFAMLDRQRIQEAIDRVRPFLQRDGGDVQLVDVTDDNIVKVKLVGACGSCPMSIMTLKGGIETELKKSIPEVKAVVAV
jgi:Fe-S cluster biogenesis protein NfuA